MKNSEHLKYIHDKLINVYNESENVDFLIKMRKIIKEREKQERLFEKYLEFISNNPKKLNISDKLYKDGKQTCFYTNCKRQRKASAKICQVCPFRKKIEEFEKKS